MILTNIKFEQNNIVFDLNGGPDGKHRFLRHVQIGGVGPDMSPVVADSGQEPAGSRLTLAFNNSIPELTGSEVKALLAPLISFDVKTPVQAFTDTLPDKLKEAILDHHVLVGMSTEMLIYAKGQPEVKSHEIEGQMPFDEWIYGKPPKDVEFVRINGNRVIRLEIAKVGEKPVVFTKDEVEGLMRTDGSPLTAQASPTAHTVPMGDASDKDNQANRPTTSTPSLSNPGEQLPGDDRRVGVMKPVQFPKEKPAPQPGANPDGVPDSPPAPDQTQPGGSQSK